MTDFNIQTRPKPFFTEYKTIRIIIGTSLMRTFLITFGSVKTSLLFLLTFNWHGSFKVYSWPWDLRVQSGMRLGAVLIGRLHSLTSYSSRAARGLLTRGKTQSTAAQASMNFTYCTPCWLIKNVVILKGKSLKDLQSVTNAKMVLCRVLLCNRLFQDEDFVCSRHKRVDDSC